MIKKILSRFEEKPTVFLILCTLIIIAGVPLMFYAMTWDGGASLYASLMFVIIFSALALWIDYLLIRLIKIKRIWANLAETSILIGLLVLAYLS